MIIKCPKCDVEFDNYSKCGPKKFCSRKCANSRIQTAEMNLARSKKLAGKPNGRAGVLYSKRIENICKICNQIFLTTEKSQKTKLYCSLKCSFKSPNRGRYKESGNRSKFGYYKGIYCGSTYELVWVIYRLDNKLTVNKFNGYIAYAHNGKERRYYPDFVDGNTIHEMKGYTTDEINLVLCSKEIGANSAGYTVKLYFKKDLQREFDWVKSHYIYKDLYELYDGFKPKYSYPCSYCKTTFTKNKKSKTDVVYCCRKCAGLGVKCRVRQEDRSAAFQAA